MMKKAILFCGVFVGVVNASAVQNLQDAIDSGLAESLAISNGVTIEAAPERDPNQGTIENTDTVIMNERLDALGQEVYGDLNISQKEINNTSK